MAGALTALFILHAAARRRAGQRSLARRLASWIRGHSMNTGEKRRSFVPLVVAFGLVLVVSTGSLLYWTWVKSREEVAQSKFSCQELHRSYKEDLKARDGRELLKSDNDLTFLMKDAASRPYLQRLQYRFPQLAYEPSAGIAFSIKRNEWKAEWRRGSPERWAVRDELDAYVLTEQGIVHLYANELPIDVKSIAIDKDRVVLLKFSTLPDEREVARRLAQVWPEGLPAGETLNVETLHPEPGTIHQISFDLQVLFETTESAQQVLGRDPSATREWGGSLAGVEGSRQFKAKLLAEILRRASEAQE